MIVITKDSHNLYILNTISSSYHIKTLHNPKFDWFYTYNRWSASTKEFLEAGNDIWQIVV